MVAKKLFQVTQAHTQTTNRSEICARKAYSRLFDYRFL